MTLEHEHPDCPGNWRLAGDRPYVMCTRCTMLVPATKAARLALLDEVFFDQMLYRLTGEGYHLLRMEGYSGF
jgi:hypothetical protein